MDLKYLLCGVEADHANIHFGRSFLRLFCDPDYGTLMPGAVHPIWTARLHHDNLVALAETRPELRPVPSYATVRRFLAARGLTKQRPMTTRQTDGALAAAARLEAREVRGYESEYTGGLWHWDCHFGSRKILTPRGEWRTPVLFGVLDDHSRLACHLQWYLSESAENIAHGLSQAMQKRGLPRSAMSDNGSAMTAAEISEGFDRLGIIHQTTLPYSPYHYVAPAVMWPPASCSRHHLPRSRQLAT